MQARTLGAALAAMVTISGAAIADPIDYKSANKMLFSPKGYEIAVGDLSALSAADQQTIKNLLDNRDFKKQAFLYYGAMAVSPGDGVATEATQVVTNLHSPAAAGASAVALCNARKKADTPCVVVMNILPKRWSQQPLSLSATATADMKTYRQGKGQKAMAVSPSSAAYSIVKGLGSRNAAVEDCQRQAATVGATDCQVVVFDE